MGETVAFEGVVKRYGGVASVEGVTLAIEGGSFVALVGRSGAGKSTLLRMVNRLIVPDAGRVLVDGREVGAGDPTGLRRRVGYVIQSVGLFPHMSVAENIGIIPRIANGPHADVAAELARVELPAAYAARMLLDEPFGALDPVTRDALAHTYRALHEALGLTTIMVTHDMTEALLMADRIVAMAHGRVVADATPRAMLGGRSAGGAARCA